MYEGAIPVMLATLDPHSAFLNPLEFRRMREQERGSYAGVGMQLVSFGSKTIVDFPFPATPAYEAGILPGDAIEMVDGRPVVGMDLQQGREPSQGRTGNQHPPEPFARRLRSLAGIRPGAPRHPATDHPGSGAVRRQLRLSAHEQLRREDRQGVGRGAARAGGPGSDRTAAGPSRQQGRAVVGQRRGGEPVSGPRRERGLASAGDPRTNATTNRRPKSRISTTRS